MIMTTLKMHPIMKNTKKVTKPRKTFNNYWNILLLLCVVVLVCVCILIPILLIRRSLNQDKMDDATFLLKVKEMFPTSGVIHTCDYLRDLMDERIPTENQQLTQQRVLDKVLRNTIDELKNKHCNETVLQCDANARFRSLNGSCNNLRFPRRGMAFRAQGRYLPPAYQDSRSSPRSMSVTGGSLPSARMVSNHVFKAGNVPESDASLTVMHMSFGQFFDHDLGFTPVHKEDDGSDIDCCLSANANRPECAMTIDIPHNDSDFLDPTDRCMNFVRSTFAEPDPLIDYRDQMNLVTSYIDASNVYGSSTMKSDILRAHTNGSLLVDEYNRLPAGPNKCFKDSTDDFCQDAGDTRVNVVPNLSATHLLWVREHNRIAEELASLNPNCNDDDLFFETRKIIIAMMQHVVYNEYLPPILNSAYMDKYDLTLRTSGWDTGYNVSYDVTTSNVFSAAAFRFGHSQITNTQAQFSVSHVSSKVVSIVETYHRPHLCEENYGIGCEGILRWLGNDLATKVDRFFETGVRNHLFPNSRNKTSDLPAININRGRDHGIQSYNSWREWCRLPRATNFLAFEGGLVNHSPEAAAALGSVYSHPDDIDLFAGAISEVHIPEGIVGPTFACILGFQFQQLKHGDRFWYERNNGDIGLTSGQLAEVRKTSLSKIICNNIPITQIQPRVFQAVSEINNRTSCSNLDDIDLQLWSSLTCS